MKNHQQASNYSLLVRELNVVRNVPLLKEAQEALVATNRDNLHGVVVCRWKNEPLPPGVQTGHGGKRIV